MAKLWEFGHFAAFETIYTNKMEEVALKVDLFNNYFNHHRTSRDQTEPVFNMEAAKSELLSVFIKMLTILMR